MKNLSIMIKPASGGCNLRCRYCFYADITEHREVASYGKMSEETLETLVKKTLEESEDSCTFVFQGGEPTLAGLDFFRSLAAFQQQYRKKGQAVHNAIQTNGTLLTGEWVEFLAKHHFLTGISVDGNKKVHDDLRPDSQGKGTFQRVFQTVEMLKKAGVDYNILTVVTRQSARHIQQIYGQYRKYGWNYMQFIPCLDEYDAERGSSFYSLKPEQYARFLKDLFDVWYQDIRSGNYVYIRYFENLVGILMGVEPESCGLLGGCHAQLVVEADGSAYPCDFYVTDTYRMGNIQESDLAELLSCDTAKRFEQESYPPHSDCISCRYGYLCRGGCRRDRDYRGMIGKNYYCESLMEFFAYAEPRLREAAEIYRSGVLGRKV